MQVAQIRRRDFISLLGGAAAAWPPKAHAQQSTMPLVGFLSHNLPDASAHLVAAFREGLSETGYVDGRNAVIEFRWASNQIDRLPELAEDLVGRGVAVIATPLSTPASLAAKAATKTIPIVFGVGTDPVKMGLVASLNRPGGNVTGIASMNRELGGKLVGLLHELVPTAARIGVLINPKEGSDVVGPFVNDTKVAATSVGKGIEVLAASAPLDIDAEFAALIEKRLHALLVSPQILFLSRRAQIVGLTLRHAMPVIFPWREASEIGGLMSYGTNLPDHYRQVGIYVGRVLKGEKPGDLPILRASKFDLVINLQTAKTIGLEVPPMLVARADEVIE
jgi:putative ABC transport system substrate-binding protein